MIGRKAHFVDLQRVYASWLNGNDYFVTNDKTEFIRGGRREQLEELMPGLKIRTVHEFLSELGQDRRPPRDDIAEASRGG